MVSQVPWRGWKHGVYKPSCVLFAEAADTDGVDAAAQCQKAVTYVEIGIWAVVDLVARQEGALRGLVVRLPRIRRLGAVSSFG